MIEKITITQLTPAEWQILRNLKLRSLEEEPLAFEDAYEGKKKYLERTEKEWRERLDPKKTDGAWIIAKDEESQSCIGSVFFIISEGAATLQHVYVDKNYRGQGIGEKLLQNVLERLKKRGDVKEVWIQVLVTQFPAINLYHKLGFQDFKAISNAAKRGDETYDEIEMKLDL